MFLNIFKINLFGSNGIESLSDLIKSMHDFLNVIKLAEETY